MQCINCNRQIPDNTKFCPYCGSKMNLSAINNQSFRICKFCGAQVEEGREFCNSCGRRLTNDEYNIEKTRSYTEKGPKKEKKGLLIALIIILIVAIVGVAAWTLLKKTGSDGAESGGTGVNNEVSDGESNEKNILLLSVDPYDYEVKDDTYVISGTASVTQKKGVVSIDGEKIKDIPVDEDKVYWSIEVELLVGRNTFTIELSDADGNERTKVVKITREPGDEDEFLFESDKYYISDYDLNGKTQEEVALIRNEIYARHGFIFSKEEYIKYFSAKSWYVPNPDFSEELFNDIEKANKDFIVQYETDRGWR